MCDNEDGKAGAGCSSSCVWVAAAAFQQHSLSISAGGCCRCGNMVLHCLAWGQAAAQAVGG
jgi:hypothetical protein